MALLPNDAANTLRESIRVHICEVLVGLIQNYQDIRCIHINTNNTPIIFPLENFPSMNKPRQMSKSIATVVAVLSKYHSSHALRLCIRSTKGSEMSIITSRPGLKSDLTSGPSPLRNESKRSSLSPSIAFWLPQNFGALRRLRNSSVKSESV